MPTDPEDLAREHRLRHARDDRRDPPSTAERYPPRRSARSNDGSDARTDAGSDAGAWREAGEITAARPDRPVTPPDKRQPVRGSQRGSEAVGAGETTEDGVDRGGRDLSPGDGAAGPELARAVLDAALAKRRDAAARAPRRRTGAGSGRRLRGYSGPGPDPRDPQLFGDMLQRLMKQRGWERPRAEATVFAAWEKVVGADIAQHSRPIKLDDGVLTVEAESTAWATQLRLLTSRLLRSIAAEVGHNVVTRLNIHGPAAPSWNRGPRRVQGRGPRDTYG